MGGVLVQAGRIQEVIRRRKAAIEMEAGGSGLGLQAAQRLRGRAVQGQAVTIGPIDRPLGAAHGAQGGFGLLQAHGNHRGRLHRILLPPTRRQQHERGKGYKV